MVYGDQQVLWWLLWWGKPEMEGVPTFVQGSNRQSPLNHSHTRAHSLSLVISLVVSVYHFASSEILHTALCGSLQQYDLLSHHCGEASSSPRLIAIDFSGFHSDWKTALQKDPSSDYRSMSMSWPTCQHALHISSVINDFHIHR